MDVRQATTADIEGIRRVARRSLEASYGFLPDEAIDSAVQKWYDDEVLETALSGSSDVFLVGFMEGEPAAFSQNVILGSGESVGEIQWLHVDPDYRGEGMGEALLDRTREVLRSQGVDRLRGVVLAGNEGGVEFYEEHDFDRAGDRAVEIAGDTYTELVFESGVRPGATGAGADVERREVDGEMMFVFRDEGDRGSKGLFYPVYHDRDRDELYGWLCGVCGATDNAMDSMGRLNCNECGNLRKPTRWDAAYL